MKQPHSPLRQLRPLLVIASLAALSGCVSMAPRLTRPSIPVSGDFPTAPAADGGQQAVAAMAWRQVFLDVRLQQVIALALENNRDLRVALLNIQSQQAQYRIQRAALLPAVDASASQSRSRATTTSGSSQISQSASAESARVRAPRSPSPVGSWTCSVASAASRPRHWRPGWPLAKPSAPPGCHWSPRWPRHG